MDKPGRWERTEVDVRDQRTNTVDDCIAPLNKGIGQLSSCAARDEIARLKWNLLREDLSLPAAVLYEERLKHNLAWMREFAAAYGAQLAPHGKTTMAPRLFEMQMEAGAWGITVATAHQARVAHEHGVRRVLMANELAGRQNMATVAAMLRDPDFEFYCLVDSAELVEQLGAFFSQAGVRLRVLLELGVDGGRCGVRNNAQLEQTLAALVRWKDAIALSGVEIYEGVLDKENDIRAFLQRAVDVTRQLVADDRFGQSPMLLTGAGSAWYDVVAEEFSSAKLGDAVEIVLRPGCYLTHDVGNYRTALKRILKSNPVAQRMNGELLPALQVWAYVQSVPEAEKAIVGLGKRDAAFDSGLPTPVWHYRPGDAQPQQAPGHWALTKMMDQHGYLRIGADDGVRVGDMIGFDISHPCLTFDKWRTISVVNSAFDVVEVIPTFF